MLVEISLVQRLTLYLGHPSYATTIVLGALLLGAGVGSFNAQRVTNNLAWLFAILVPAVVGIISFGLLSNYAGDSVSRFRYQGFHYGYRCWSFRDTNGAAFPFRNAPL